MSGVTDDGSTKEDHATAVRVRPPSPKSTASLNRFNDPADAITEHHYDAARVRQPSQVSLSSGFDNEVDAVSEHDYTAARLRRPSLKLESSLVRFDDAADALGEHHNSAARHRRPSLMSLPSSRSVTKNCPYPTEPYTRTRTQVTSMAIQSGGSALAVVGR